MTDRTLEQEFELQKFERTIMGCDDVYALQELCVRLFSMGQAQRVTYEALLKDAFKRPRLSALLGAL